MRTKILSVIIGVLMAVQILPDISNAQTADEVIIYVDAAAKDGGSGSKDSPFSDISQAKEYIRTINSQMSSDIRVIIKGGRYYLDETLEFSAEDSGKNGFDIIYEGAKGENVEISGGRSVNGWELADKEKNIYRAYVGYDIDSRGFYVNGDYKVRARSKGSFSNSDYAYLEGTTDEQKQSDLAHQYSIGYKTTDTYLKDFKNQKDMEVVLITRYRMARCLVEEICEADESGYVNVIMNGRAETESVGWYNVVKAAGSQSVDLFRYPLYYENAYELLDECGEWYLDKTQGYIYYKPEADEDINSIDAVVGTLEKLVTISGTNDKVTDFSKTVRNISFKNINFCHTDWDYIENVKGVYFEQANTIKVVDVKKSTLSFQNELPVSAVTVETARNVSFDECEFYNLAMNALKITIGVQNCSIRNCEFYNIGGNAINAGEVGYVGVTSQSSANYKYNPSDNHNPDSAVKVNRNILINNNHVSRVGRDSLASVGIMTGYLAESEVSNNEVDDVPYSGIHVGWGWGDFEAQYDGEGNVTQAARDVITRNVRICNNYIHNHMNGNTISDYLLYVSDGSGGFSPVKAYFVDGGGIYYFGKSSGCNSIYGNYIAEQKSSHAYFYADLGAAKWDVYNNVIDARNSNAPWYNPPGKLHEAAPFWSYIARFAYDLNYYDNYSTTASYYTSMNEANYVTNNISFNTPNIYADANWSDEASKIINAAGILENAKANSFDNYIFNGDFEIDAAVWKAENPNAVIEQTGDSADKSNGVLKVLQGQNITPVSQTMFLEANKEYIFRARVKSDAENVSVRLLAQDEDGVKMTSGYYITDAEWKNVYVRYKGTGEAVKLSVESNEAADYYIDDIYVGAAPSEMYEDEKISYKAVDYYDSFESNTLRSGYYTNTNAPNTAFEVVSGGANESKGALLITQNDDKGVGLYRDFEFEAGKTYIISCYIRLGDDVAAPQSDVGNGKKIAFKIGSDTYDSGKIITHDWQKISLEYTPTETGTKCIQILPAKNGFTTKNGLCSSGDIPKLYYDDLYIAPVSDTVGTLRVTLPEKTSIQTLKSGIKADIENTTQSNKSFSIITAAYKEQALVDVKLTDVEAPWASTSVSSVMYNSVEDADTVKVIVMNTDTMIPLTKALCAQQ